MRLITMVLVLWTGSALAQEAVRVVSVRIADEAETRTRLAELMVILSAGSGRGLVFEFDPSTGAYQTDSRVDPPGDRAQAEITFDLNAWRSADPDAFEPGPMNAVAGSFGLADARTIDLTIDASGNAFAIRWDRRKEDPEATPRHELVLAERASSEADSCEVWRIERLGIGMFTAWACRAGLALEPGERSPSDWAIGDFWLRGRSTLLRSLNRSTVRTELAITEDLRSGLVFRFDPAVKAESLVRASARIVPSGIPSLLIRDKNVLAQYAVAKDDSGAVVVVAPTEADLAGVLSALGLETVSGGDGP